MADEVKVGAYIYKGCDLGNRLNADQLEMIAIREGCVATAKTHDFLCGAEGVKMIHDDLDGGEANRVVIAACSRRAKTDAFNFAGVPITHIMHGLTTYAKRLNLVPKTQPTAKFAQLFWNNLTSKGRVNELKLGISLYFMYGFGEGIKVAKANQKLGLSMLKTKRMAINEAGLEMKNDKNIRHMVEVLVEDIGMAAITEKVKKPLEGIKIAGYVGCQTNRPFGIDGESFENPQYLDNMVEAVGAEPIRTYEKKVSCCGGALAFSEPDKSFNLIKPILESAMDNGADMIVTPCPVCQMNTEVYQDKINEKFGTNFNIPVVYYSTLMLVAFGRSAADSALNGQVIQAQKLNKIVG